MASKREQVLAAVEALVKTALPNADVKRNRDKAFRIGPGGAVSIEDGEPGEPDVDLSPLTYNYSHRIPLVFGAYESATKTPGQVLDEMQTAVGQAVEANRTLGGLCDFLSTEAPDRGELDIAGAESGGQTAAAIVADYSTSSPL